GGRLPGPRVAATGVGPGERPEPLAGGPLLDQDRPAVGAEDVDGEGQVQGPGPSVGGDEVGGPGRMAVLVAQDDLARRGRLGVAHGSSAGAGPKKRPADSSCQRASWSGRYRT